MALIDPSKKNAPHSAEVRIDSCHRDGRSLLMLQLSFEVINKRLLRRLVCVPVRNAACMIAPTQAI